MSSPDGDGQRCVPEDFATFVAEEQVSLQRYAMLLCADAHLAQDLVQEVLIKVYRQWDRVSAAASPRAYVHTMTTNEFLSWRRRRSYAERPVDTATLRDEGEPDRTDELAISDELRRALLSLKPKQRACLVMRYYADLPDAEIGERLGYTAGSVRSLAQRALNAIRPALVPEGELS